MINVFLVIKFNQEAKPVKEINTSRMNVDPLVFTLNAYTEPNLKVLTYFYETHIEQFTFDLLELNAAIVKLDKDVLELESTLNRYNSHKQNWSIKISEFLNSFFESFLTKVIIINNPQNTLDTVTYNRLRVNLKQLDASKRFSRFEICGYKDSVLDLVKKIKSVD